MFITIEEKIAVVEVYIHHKTDKQIRVSPRNINLGLLNKAYDVAINWMNNFNAEVIVL